MPWAACTIAAKARLPSARVVARSFAEHHPDVPFFVLLADEVEGCFDPAAEPYELLGLDALDLPDLRARCFRYEREQLSYALTPTLLRCVLDRGFERVALPQAGEPRVRLAGRGGRAARRHGGAPHAAPAGAARA